MLTEMVEKARAFLRGRRIAYNQVFNPNTPDGALVLKDLAKFCRAHGSTFNADSRVHAILEGRREVWLRIQNHLNLTEDQLWELYGKGN